MTLTTSGDREIALRFETFPDRVRQRITQRVSSLIDSLKARIKAATPYDAANHSAIHLRDEIESRMYTDQPDRVAGYVSVYSPGDPKQYPKAATLEYGSDAIRRKLEKSASLFDRFGRPKRRVIGRANAAAHIRAFAYLRGPFEGIKSEAETSLGEALSEATEEANG